MSDKKYAVIIWRDINEASKMKKRPIYREAETIREAENIVYNQLLQRGYDIKYEIIEKRIIVARGE